MSETSELRYTPEQVIAALEATGGVRLGAALKLGCVRQTICDYIARFDVIRAALVEIEETQKDLAETHLMVALGKGERWAVIRYLEVKAVDRGWGRLAQGPGARPPGHDSAQPMDLSKLSDEDLRLLDGLVDRLTAGAGASLEGPDRGRVEGPPARGGTDPLH